MKQNLSKVFQCSIHGQIRVSPLAMKFIDTAEFQRMKDLRQLGIAVMVYHTANHTRFEHSLGVYHLAGIMLDNLHKTYPKLTFDNNYLGNGIRFNLKVIELIKIAALCHDIGHGPYSHMFDEILLADSNHPNKEHEKRSELIVEIIAKRECSGEISDKEIEFIKSVINPRDNDVGFIYQVVSNSLNGIDVDKLDYLARDSMMTGQGSFLPYPYLIDLKIDQNSNICYPKQISMAITDIFHQRYKLHRTVYQHKTVKLCEYYMVTLMKLIDPLMGLTDSINDMSKFCQFTDHHVISFVESYFSRPKYLMSTLSAKQEENLVKAKKIIDLIDTRQFFKFVGEFIVKTDSTFAVTEILKYDKEIPPDSVLVIDYKLGYVSGSKPHPLKSVYFYNKKEMISSFTMDPKQISFTIPGEQHQEKIYLIFSRHKKYYQRLRECYIKYSEELHIQ